MGGRIGDPGMKAGSDRAHLGDTAPPPSTWAEDRLHRSTMKAGTGRGLDVPQDDAEFRLIGDEQSLVRVLDAFGAPSHLSR